jgi:putative resolvase
LLWTSGFRKSAARFLALIERIQRGEVERVLIAHKGQARSLRIRPARPSCARELCEIIAVNQESLSPEQEMVEGLLAIVHTFSCRLYGMRKVKKQIKEDYPGSKEPKEILE